MRLLKYGVTCGLKSLGKRIPSILPPIIIASVGRAGSTVLYDSVIAAVASQRFAARNIVTQIMVSDTLWHKKTNLSSGIVYKTHGREPECYIDKAKIIYIHDKPSDVIKSLQLQHEKLGQTWITQHQLHLGVEPFEFGCALQSDRFYLLDHVKSWSKWKKHENLLFISRYDIWHNKQLIENFLGLPVTLPDYRAPQSSSKLLNHQAVHIEKAYENLDSQYNQIVK